MAALVGVVGIFALIWGLTYHELIFTAFFAPKFENVRHRAAEYTGPLPTDLANFLATPP